MKESHDRTLRLIDAELANYELKFYSAYTPRQSNASPAEIGFYRRGGKPADLTVQLANYDRAFVIKMIYEDGKVVSGTIIKEFDRIPSDMSLVDCVIEQLMENRNA